MTSTPGDTGAQPLAVTFTLAGRSVLARQADTPAGYELTAAGAPYECYVAPLGSDWMIIGYVVLQGSELVLGELRIIPRAAVDDPEMVLNRSLLLTLPAWSGAERGIHTSVPPGGITTSIVRGVRTGAPLRDFRTVILRQMRADADAREMMAAMGTAPLIAPAVRLDRKGRSRSRRLPDDTFIPVAREYAAAIRRGSRAPAQDCAKALAIPEATARNWVRRARAAGLLTPSRKRVAGGELTARGRQLAARLQRRSRTVELKATTTTRGRR